MAEILLNNIYLTVFLPLWIFLIIMIGRFFSVFVNRKIIYFLTILTSFLGSLLTGIALYKIPNDVVYDNQFIFIKINDFIINCGLHIDKTALIFAFVLFLVSMFVQIFAISYMKNDKKSYRFFALLNLFNFAMSALFFSPNLYQTYFFWEIAGVVSYLLIAYDYKNKICNLASKKVFIINRIGDTAFLAGIIITSYYMYVYANNPELTSLSYLDFNIISIFTYAYTPKLIYIAICLLFTISAFVKSAQFPFYTWLQDAMCAKLPVSALLHSATLVALGLFLTIRLIPLFILETFILKFIIVIGILTAFICSINACSQRNPKSVLAYSTSAQLGLALIAIGELNIKAAIIFFVAHAFIKTLLFLTLPNDEKWNYYNFAIFVLSALSLSGLIFAGMVSKELIYTTLGKPLSVIYCIIAFLTTFYIIKIALLLVDKNGITRILKNKLELFTHLGLLLCNIIFYFYIRTKVEYKIAEPFWWGLTAWGCVYIMHLKNLFWRVPIIYQLSLNGFYLDKFYNTVITKIYNITASICNNIEIKIFSNYKFTQTLAKFLVKFFEFIENNIMNGYVKLINGFSTRISILDSTYQSGNVQTYNMYALIIITTIIICLVITYTAVLSTLGGPQ